MIRPIVEFLLSLALFVNAMLYVPQAVRLYRTKDVKGQSLLMFLGFNVIQLLTICHAYLARDWVLMAGFVLSFITCGAVTLQLILYQNKKGASLK